jgi:DNA polymerase-3 subunit alpha
MDKRATSKIKFVGLHAHSVAGSPFDGMGYPKEHMDFAYSNGSDALALTDHGNMNGLAYQVLHGKKMSQEGRNFKPIYGVEAYFIPSLTEWRQHKEEYDKKKKTRKKANDENSGTTVEDETASKSLIKNRVNRRRHMVLLARDQQGLNNIFQLISKSYTQECFYRYPRIDYDMLSEHSEGVIAASACMGGVYAGDFWENRDNGAEAVLDAMRTTTKTMVEIFGDNWYGELQWNAIPEQHEINNYVIQMSKEFGIELISTADSHYPRPDLWKDREMYKRLGWLSFLKNSDGENLLPASVEDLKYELYPKNGNQMWESYKKYSEACGVEYDDQLILDSIERTYEIAHEKVESFFPDNEVRLPDFVVPEGMAAGQALVKDCVTALKSKELHKKQEYVDRLRYELGVIEDRGFSKYFLTMKAISDRVSAKQLVGAGRGSAAGSLVAYVLDITQIDPIKYNLQFERFLRKDATDYPDIDYDCAEPMEAKEMLIEEWGDDVVVPITNWNTLQLRSLIKDISKFYGIDWGEVNTVTGRMMSEATPRAKQKHGIKAGVYTPTFEEVMEFSSSLSSFLEKYPAVKTHVLNIYGQVRSASRHAGGCLVGEQLNKHMPLIASGGVRQTPWSEGQNVRHLEPMGFIKFDILGLASLRMLDGAIRHILKRHKENNNPTFDDVKAFYDKYLHPENINFEDKKVWKQVFHKGKWVGVFQFTAPGAQKFCQQVKPTNLVDLAAITSIYRPGPLSANVHKQYTRAIHDPDTIHYDHPLMKEILEETYGFIIFQEQLASIAHKMGKNVSLDEGNLLRKLLTKKGTGKGAEDLEKIKVKFINGCEEKGLSSYQSEDIWTQMEFFSGYGFNASHAISYATLSYQCAWLLTHYPSEWTAAFLDKEPEQRKEAAISVAKSIGFHIESLNINTSGRVWEISENGKTLIQPLTSIKGLGATAIDQIVNNRPFHEIEDFLFNENITYSKLNKKALDVLIRSEALDPLMDERFKGRRHFWFTVAVERPRKLKNLEENIEPHAKFLDTEGEGLEFNIEDRINNLVNLTGMYPMHLVMNDKTISRLREKYVPPISEYDPELELVWFIPRKVIPRKTKNDKTYWILEVTDANNILTSIKCWGIKGTEAMNINQPYIAKLEHDEQWGFSTRSIRHNFRLLG